MYNRSIYLFVFVLGSLLFALLPHTSFAQSANLIIDENVLQSGRVSYTASGYYYNTGIGVFPSVHAKTSNSTFIDNYTGKSFPVERMKASVIRTNEIRSTITMSPNDQVIIGTTLGMLSFASGPFDMRYHIDNINNYAWQAGQYQTNLLLSIAGISLGTSVTPKSANIKVTVPTIANITNPLSDIEIHINSLDYFRQGYTSNYAGSLDILHTVPLDIMVATSSNEFDYQSNLPFITTHTASTSAVKYQMRGVTSGNIISLGSDRQKVMAQNFIPNGNVYYTDQGVSISAQDLIQYFLYAGIYRTDLSYILKSTQSTHPLEKIYNTRLKVNVEDLSELKINIPQVNLSFTTATNYKTGVSQTINNHIAISKTTPYVLTVKSESDYFINGSSSLPISILQISSADGDQVVNTINNISSTPQVLIHSDTPQLDKKYNVVYSIPEDKASELLNKKEGTYSTVITYTLTAP